MAIPWRLTHLLHNRNYSKTRPLTLNLFIFFLRYTGRLDFIHYSLFSSFLSFCYDSINYLHNYQKTIKKREEQFHNADDENNSNNRVQSDVHMLKTKHQLRQSTLEHRSGFPLSLTSPRLLAGLLAVQGGTKTHSLNKTMLLRCWRGTWNLEASFHRASTDAPPSKFPRRNTQVAGTWNTSWRSSHKDILHPSLFYNIRDPHTGSRCRTIGWRPDSTHRIPLLLWVLQHPPPIKSLAHTPTDVSYHLRTRRSLHVAPWLEDSAVSDSVRYSYRLSQHGNPWVWKEAPLREMGTPHKFLAKDRTLHLILTNHCPIQIDDEPPTTSHWSAHNESCQLENLKKQINVLQITTVKLWHIGHDTYFKQMLPSTEASLRTAERQDITYVRAAPRWRPLQLSLLLNEGLLFRPATLDLIAVDPSAL